jgi:hypothetical protein
MKGKSSAHQASPRKGTQISSRLRKKRRKGMRRLKSALHGDDVHPAAVVRQHQVVAVAAQRVQPETSKRVGVSVLDQPAVEADPAFGDAHQRERAGAAASRDRHQPLQQRDQEQRGRVHDGAEHDQQQHRRSA